MVPHLVLCPADRVEGSWRNLVVRHHRGSNFEAPRGASLRRVEFESLEDLPDGVPFDGLRVVVDLADAALVGKLETIRRRHPALNIWVRPTGNRMDVVRASGRAGIPVVFGPDAAEALGAGVGLELLEYYLFEPDLAVPIEPFHSLLRAELGEDRSLWNIWFGHPADHFFIDEQGNVSLCAAWCKRPERRYGRAKDGPGGWRASLAHKELVATLKRDGLAKACRDCPARRRCHGVVQSVTGKDSCGDWPEIFVRIELAAKALLSGGTKT